MRLRRWTGRMTETPATITRALHNYLADWLAWVERGAPDGEPYSRAEGLCGNADGLDLAGVINRAVGGLIFPFGGVFKFAAERESHSMHLNEARLSWVRRTILTAEITDAPTPPPISPLQPTPPAEGGV